MQRKHVFINIYMVFIQNKFQNIIFLREYRRERSEFDVSPGLKFINIYIKVGTFIIMSKTSAHLQYTNARLGVLIWHLRAVSEHL